MHNLMKIWNGCNGEGDHVFVHKEPESADYVDIWGPRRNVIQKNNFHTEMTLTARPAEDNPHES